MPERGWTIQERFYVTETDRLAVGAWYGNKKMAPLAQVRRFVRANGTNGLEAAIQEYERTRDAGSGT